MNVTRRAIAIVLISMLLGCAGAPGVQQSASNAPVDFVAMEAREVDILEPEPLVTPDGLLSFTVPARFVETPEFSEGSYTLEFTLGGDVNSICWAYPEGIDLATMLASFSDLLLDPDGVLSAQHKKILSLDGGAVGRHPHLSVLWKFQGIEDDRPAIGNLHLRTAVKGNLGLVCALAEIGFAKSFETFFTELVASAQYHEMVEPYFVEVHRFSVNGRFMGVETVELTLDQDGDTRIATVSAFAAAASSTEIDAEDTYETQYSTESGMLINQIHNDISGGALMSALRLSYADEGHWNVNGTFQQKDLSGVIEAGRLQSTLGQTRNLLAMLRDGSIGDKLTSQGWIASGDPLSLIDMTSTYIEKLDAGRYLIDVEFGPVVSRVTMDATGSTEHATIPIGGLEMTVERIFQSGGF